MPSSDLLSVFHPAVRAWFTEAFAEPTRAQRLGWPPIARGESTLILAPTGSGKTLTAFLWALNRLLFEPPPAAAARCRVLYISPLKALAVDVERNLRAPLAGIAQQADRLGHPFHAPAIAVRTGDTPAAERAAFRRQPADLLITTPESLYLLLTSAAREALRSIDTVIIDEIHALVPTKRGAHLALSLERLAALGGDRLQRIGLSATQRPLDEVARFLGGTRRAKGAPGGGPAAERQAKTSGESAVEREFTSPRDAVYRPVTIVDAGRRKALKLSIEVPVEDLARVSTADEIPSGPASVGDRRPSVWAAIHPRLLALIREHRSTLIFVNSRRLAERLAGAINELAGEVLVRSHHGSIARLQRLEVEELLKSGSLRALVATSSLELGIDMGAIDLVVQIEAPPSVSSGLQRIGRSGHRLDGVSEGVIFPKFRGDLVASAAVARAMHDGAVETTRYPRNPLDILAQQIVAAVSMDTWHADDLFATVRRAAPFAELGRGAFDGVLDMLSGRYPSDEFAELRPRVTWHRASGMLTARAGAKNVAVINGGTIPDRGLFGVFLVGAGPGAARVGELDEEMVFESRVGETFVLGASSWRIEEITHDRVLVSPAPGEPGKMPFWKGDRAGRPLELGLAIGRLMRTLVNLTPAAALDRLTSDHDLDRRAAEQLLQYLTDQMAVTRALPDASTVIVERVRDELGDWRVCVLSPRGGRVHAPWAMAVAATIREEKGIDVETLWGDDGFVVRFPDVDEPPDPRLLMPDPEEAHALVVRQLGATALFAAKFRENAARSLLLPKRRPGQRAPLWQQRKRSADLLAVAARHGSFPVLLETYRECLRDFFDMPALVATLADVRSRRIRVVTVDTDRPSPFAASLLFSYVASFLYDGDAPLAERRAQALLVDQGQLRELIGEGELRDLLDPDAIAAVESQLQRLDPRFHARTADGVHDMLLGLGDLTRTELEARTVDRGVADSIDRLVTNGRALILSIAAADRYVAVEDASRFRDALGVTLPAGVPDALLEAVADPIGDLAMRYARTHPPFDLEAFAHRFGLTAEDAEAVLVRLTTANRLLQGAFRPGESAREWTDPGVLRMIRLRSLARLRREVEPVDPPALGRFVTRWQGVAGHKSLRGPDALLDIVERIQGAPLAASILETELLPARIDGYDPGDLDAVMAAGEVIWVGLEPLGTRDGRIALYLAADALGLLPPESALDPERLTGLRDRDRAILEHLAARGASFFAPLHEAAGGGYPAETVTALWGLAWKGLVTNDTYQAVRAFTDAKPAHRRVRPTPVPFRSRRLVPPSAEGRWSLVPRPLDAARTLEGRGADRAPRRARSGGADVTTWATAVAQQLLTRHGVLTREAVAAESVPGGFAVLYPVLKALEDAGRIRRGYFVAGLGATQFALPGALDLLRSSRNAQGDTDGDVEVAVLAAADPANPYGATLKWPALAAPAASVGQISPENAAGTGYTDSPAAALRGPTRTVGATVILVDGGLVGYLARGDRVLLTQLPEAEPQRSRAAKAIAAALIERARAGGDTPRGMLIEEIDGVPPAAHPMAKYLVQAGFQTGALGFQATYLPGL